MKVSQKQSVTEFTASQPAVTKNWHAITLIDVTTDAAAARHADDEFTLAALAARGPGNERITRRGRLMARIEAFERIAREAGHVGSLITLNCPSQMRPTKLIQARVAVNLGWDGTTSEEAHAYLVSMWARTRCALAGVDIHLYGMRISEPSSDGDPVLHCLFFHRPEDGGFIQKAARIGAADAGVTMSSSFEPERMGYYLRKYVFAALDREGVDLYGEA